MFVTLSTNLLVTVHGGNTKRPHKSESNGKGVFKLHEMYTNRAYESEMDSRTGPSGHSNSGDPTPSPSQPPTGSPGTQRPTTGRSEKLGEPSLAVQVLTDTERKSRPA